MTDVPGVEPLEPVDPVPVEPVDPVPVEPVDPVDPVPVEPVIDPVIELGELTFTGGSDPFDYPPIADIAWTGTALYGIDSSLCLRPSTANSTESNECSTGISLRGQGLPQPSQTSRLAVDSVGTFFLAIALESFELDGSVFGMLAAVNSGAATDVLSDVDFTAGLGIDVREAGGQTQVYVLDRDPSGYRIRVFDSTLALLDTISIASVPLANPSTLVVDDNGAMYVTSELSPRIQRLTTTGGVDASFQPTLPADSAALFAPIDLAVDAQGRVYALDAADPVRPIKVFTSGGVLIPSQFQLEPAFSFESARAVEVDTAGRVFLLNTASFPLEITEETLDFGEGLFTFAPVASTP